MSTIKRRKMSHFDDIMRNNKLKFLQLFIQDKIAGKQSVSRRRLFWLKNLRECLGCSTTSLALLKSVSRNIHDCQPPIEDPKKKKLTLLLSGFGGCQKNYKHIQLTNFMSQVVFVIESSAWHCNCVEQVCHSCFVLFIPHLK